MIVWVPITDTRRVGTGREWEREVETRNVTHRNSNVNCDTVSVSL